MCKRSLTKSETQFIENSIHSDPDDTPWKNVQLEVLQLRLKELEIDTMTESNQALEECDTLQMELDQYTNELDAILKT